MHLLKCDHCGKVVEFDKHELRLIKVYRYDSYGNDVWDYNIHICKDCLKKLFGRI